MQCRAAEQLYHLACRFERLERFLCSDAFNKCRGLKRFLGPVFAIDVEAFVLPAGVRAPLDRSNWEQSMRCRDRGRDVLHGELAVLDTSASKPGGAAELI